MQYLRTFSVIMTFFMVSASVQAMDGAYEDASEKYSGACSRAITPPPGRINVSEADELVKRVTFEEEFIGFLERFRGKDPPSSQLTCSYVELLFRDAALQGEEDNSAMKRASERAKSIIIKALESEADSPLLLKALFRYFLPLQDAFAIEAFTLYCKKLAEAKRKEIGRLYRRKRINEIDSFKDIRKDPLIATAMEWAQNIAEPIVQKSEVIVRASIAEVNRAIKLREMLSYANLLNRLDEEDEMLEMSK